MTFSHFETEGHRKSAANGKCDACHSLDGLTSAQQVLDVPIPQETSQGCRKCHVVQRQRFHWE